MRDVDFMNELVGHWREYESKHHRRSYKRKRTSASKDMRDREVSEEDLLMDGEPGDYALLELPARPAAMEHEEV